MSPDPSASGGPGLIVPPPPASLPGTPVVVPLATNTILRRVHRDHDAAAFNPTAQPSILDGGRFDSLDGAYAYTYLGQDDEGAIAETLCRDLPLGGAVRLVPRRRIAGQRITSVEAMRDLRILILHGAALSQVGAGLWLTKSEADQYVATRAWAAWLQDQLPDIDGFQYRCRHDEDRLAWVLFDGLGSGNPRAAGGLQSHPDTIALDGGSGLVEVERILTCHNAAIESA